ncbi:MAG: L-histidine N(alpha)-methyltransferase [Mariniphaga sp.]
MQQHTITSAIASETMNGLSSMPKFLSSKYFYDDAGSAIFQDIMKMPEYYLTRCEEEIFLQHKEAIARGLGNGKKSFSLVELGSGDGQKTKILLRHLAGLNFRFQYIPIDISQKANDDMKAMLNREIPEVKVYPRTGDYFKKLGELNGFAADQKVILFLGSNIGNFSDAETDAFLRQLAGFTRSGDKLMIGFDLKKSPKIIIDAYSDPHGHTRRFNLNLLERLNRELNADFNIGQFEQHTEYNPETGEVKSFLMSTDDQHVHVGALEKTFHFKKWETVFVERSRKYDIELIARLAEDNGFRVKQNFTDSRNYFVDSLWERMA